jgi:hypothetical protein
MTGTKSHTEVRLSREMRLLDVTLIGFGAFLGLWMGVNSLVILSRPPDPYPYIFLNLVLSCPVWPRFRLRSS